MLQAAILLCLASLVSANFLQTPQVQWSYTLPRSNQQPLLRQGNAVTSSNDDSLLFITTQDARVFVLSTENGLPVNEAFVAPTIPNVETSCNSGVALAQDAIGVAYAVYAVIDTPTNNADDTIRR